MIIVRRWLAAIACSAALFLASHANAACPSPLTAKDAAAASQNFATQNDASNNCVLESAAYQAVQFPATLQSSAVASGNGTALSTTGLAGASMTVNCSSCSGGTTVNFEAQEDGSNFVPIMGTKLDGSSQATSTTTAGVTVWQFNLSGIQQIRARISGYSAGTVTVTAHAIAVPSTFPTVGTLGNIIQFGGTNVNTGTGAGGTGTPRVTVSNDSSMQPLPGTANGWSPKLENALSTTVQTVKGSAGKLGTMQCSNVNSVQQYVQVFDISGTVTLGSSTPVDSFPIPPGPPTVIDLGFGHNFANAIKVAATTTATGSAAPPTALDCNMGFN